MPKKLTTEEFINNVEQIHGDKYDYSLVEYKGTRYKIKIICPQHGEFSVTPNDHISKSSGCPTCSNRKKHTTESFIERAKRIHNNKYDYSLVEYKNGHAPVTIICPIHGTFTQIANSHLLQKAGCEKCSYIRRGKNQRKSKTQFVTEAQEIHGDKYDYSLVKYKGTHKKVKILCSKHGTYEQRPLNHINKKQGCPHCFNERRKFISKGGYTETYFNTFPEQQKIPAELYLVHICKKTDNYLKIGITIRTTKERFSTAELRKQDYDILKTVKYPLYTAFTVEQQILKEMKSQQYWPNHLTGGKTECIKNSKGNIQTILTLMDKYSHEIRTTI